MKNIIAIAILFSFVLASCSKQNQAPETMLDEPLPDTTTGAIANHSGNFIKGPYGTVTGNAKIYLQDGNYTLALENISISNGPDLHVYLSREIQPVNFIDLGKLKSTNGNQLYPINDKPDFTIYKYALIHCQQYNHLFGSAELK